MTALRIALWTILVVAIATTELLMAHRVRGQTGAIHKLTDDLARLAALLSVSGGLAAALALPGVAIGSEWLVIPVGALVGFGGVILRAVAMKTLGRHYTLTPTIIAGHGLVTQGPYRLVRHPGYTGILLELTGLAMVVGSWLALFSVLLVLGSFLIRVKVEERMLAEHFGTAYGLYRDRTPYRLIPGLI